jgi:hypothetical protein
VGVKAGGAPRPPFSPLSQPFPATASAEGRQFNGAPSPARGEGAKPSPAYLVPNSTHSLPEGVNVLHYPHLADVADKHLGFVDADVRVTHQG